MVKIKRSPPATEDLREILHFMSKNSPEFSNYFKVSILEKIEFLSRFPQMGRKVPEVDNRNKRELIFQNYRIIYRYFKKKEMVEIITIIHGSRQINL